MTVSVLTVLGWLLATLSIALIRLGWRGRKPVALAGWVLATLSLLLLEQADGAWGIATGFTLAIALALAILGIAGWQSPGPAPRAVSERASTGTLRETPNKLGRRVAVFLLVVPLSFVAAQLLAYAIHLRMRSGAPLDADSLALMLFLQPVLWTTLMCWQMLFTKPSRMLAPPLIAVALGAIVWGLS